MIVKMGENKSQTINNATIKGVLFNIYLKAAAVNVAIDAAVDFVRTELSLKVELRRTGQNMNIASDNMSILGLFSALQYGLSAWTVGNVLVAEGVATKGEKLVQCFFPFGGCINLKDTDELNIQVLAGRAVFGAALDSAISYIEFEPVNGIGYEMGTPQTISQVVQASITQERYSMGDFVTKLAFLNFDKTTLASPVINNVMVSSDKLSVQSTFWSLLNMNNNVLLGPQRNYTQETGLLQSPQSVMVFASPESQNKEISNVQVQASYDGAQVAAGKNFWVATRFLMSPETTNRALRRAEKHRDENFSKI